MFKLSCTVTRAHTHIAVHATCLVKNALYRSGGWVAAFFIFNTHREREREREREKGAKKPRRCVLQNHYRATYGFPPNNAASLANDDDLVP